MRSERLKSPTTMAMAKAISIRHYNVLCIYLALMAELKHCNNKKLNIKKQKLEVRFFLVWVAGNSKLDTRMNTRVESFSNK